MKLLLDQDVYAVTARFLKSLEHDVVLAAGAGLSRADDMAILRRAQQEERILVTRDRDFGALVFTHDVGAGVIYLRIKPSTIEAVHSELERAIEEHFGEELQGAFIVVEPGRHRFRRHPGPE